MFFNPQLGHAPFVKLAFFQLVRSNQIPSPACNLLSTHLLFAKMPMNLKVTFATGASMKLMGLPDDITLDGLHAHLFEKTSIPPHEQHGKIPIVNAYIYILWLSLSVVK